jgi:hypothetical protein
MLSHDDQENGGQGGEATSRCHKGTDPIRAGVLTGEVHGAPPDTHLPSVTLAHGPLIDMTLPSPVAMGLQW